MKQQHLPVRLASTERQTFPRIVSPHLLNESPSPIAEDALCGLPRTSCGIVTGTCMTRAHLLRPVPCTKCSLYTLLLEHSKYIWRSTSALPVGQWSSIAIPSQLSCFCFLETSWASLNGIRLLSTMWFLLPLWAGTSILTGQDMYVVLEL